MTEARCYELFASLPIFERAVAGYRTAMAKGEVSKVNSFYREDMGEHFMKVTGHGEGQSAFIDWFLAQQEHAELLDSKISYMASPLQTLDEVRETLERTDITAEVAKPSLWQRIKAFINELLNGVNRSVKPNDTRSKT